MTADETQQRLHILYTKHHKWLYATIYKLCKNNEIAEDLVSELYLYLGEKDNRDLYYNDSFNLLYCRMYLTSRYYNLYKRDKKLTDFDLEDFCNQSDSEYDYEEDKMLETKYNEVMSEIQGLSKTKLWVSAAIYQMYSLTDYTIEDLSKNIGISPSTTFRHIKIIREHIKNTIKAPE